MVKTVLFVTYGGGHARMVAPVVRALQSCKDIRTEILALTVGGAIMKSEGLPYKGYKDFITPDDKAALEWGRKLAAVHHSPDSGMEEAESIAYLGLSYQDLVTRHGEAEAAKLWKEKGRHAFLQLTVLERIIDQVKPDMVVTTNSPKSEQAAVAVARSRGIPTLSMVDLFGVHHFHALDADYITVMSQRVIENMEEEGVTRPRDAYLITGNPAFDQAFDYRGPVDHAWRKQHFPSLPEGAKALLWIDMPAYWNLAKRELYVRSEEEIILDLDTLAHATKINNGSMLIRPHPSQPRALYDAWMKRTGHSHVVFAGGLPLYPLLKAVDVVSTYTSTVSSEALLMQRRVVQLKYLPGKSDLPLGQWGVAWQAEKPGEVADCVRKAFENDEEAVQMQARAARIYPQEKAAPKIAAHIRRIVGAHG
jgi:hypothetical protein